MPVGASASTSQRQRDPAARTRLGWLVLALVLLWPMLQTSGFSLRPFFDAGNLKVISGFLANFLPPETGSEFLGYLGQAALETLAIATAGMALAFVIAVPMAYLSTGAARERVTLNPVARSVLTILRGIPELVWALVFVRVFGLGPAAGVLALGLTYGGMLAKVYAEILESTDPAPARALRASGAARLQALLYGAAAGGQGADFLHRLPLGMRYSRLGGHGLCRRGRARPAHGPGHEDAQREAASILLAFMLLVAAADLLSWWLRRALDAAPAARALPFGWRTAIFLLAACAGLWASLGLLDMDLPALFTQDAAQSMGDFVRGFFPPDVSQPWLLKVAQGVWETLAISIIGTLLAAAAGLLLALPLASAVEYGAQCCARCPSWSGPPSRRWPWAWARLPVHWPWLCTPRACWGASMPRLCKMPRRACQGLAPVRQ